MALTTRLTINLTGEQTNALDLGTASFPLSVPFQGNLASGTGAGQADTIFSDLRTLASGANEDIDLAGSLPSALGGNATLAKARGFLIIAAEGNTTRLTISRPASNGAPIFAAAGDATSIGPGGVVLLWDPSLAGLATVTGGTGDLINIANASGAAASYRIVVIGASA